MRINTAGKAVFWAFVAYGLSFALMWGIVVLGVWATRGG